VNILEAHKRQGLGECSWIHSCLVMVDKHQHFVRTVFVAHQHHLT
jgi:hypothetical protein